MAIDHTWSKGYDCHCKPIVPVMNTFLFLPFKPFQRSLAKNIQLNDPSILDTVATSESKHSVWTKKKKFCFISD